MVVNFMSVKFECKYTNKPQTYSIILRTIAANYTIPNVKFLEWPPTGEL